MRFLRGIKAKRRAMKLKTRQPLAAVVVLISGVLRNIPTAG